MVLKWLYRAIRGKRGEFDRAMEMRRLVEEELSRRGVPVMSGTFEGDAREEIIDPVTYATYLLIDFDPTKNPEADEVPPNLNWDGRKELILSGGPLIRTARWQPTAVRIPDDHLEQDADLIYGIRPYGGADECYSWNGEISLKKSVSHLHNRNRPLLATLIGDIASPLSRLNLSARQEYLADLLSAKQSDRPDIYQLSAAARYLFAGERPEPFVKPSPRNNAPRAFLEDF